ncbi:DUF6531 domain-containing protein [Streptomyces sp. NBC_00400]|uniref:RHS repeat-associated core domain-containing protein n=1 Tax=Streptomyces sp. NBC_00400 TaxID=2975737 RepID=UPI002E247F1B
MGVVLPGWADELLDLIGVSWPNVDEDDYRDMADAMREFADDIAEGADQAHTAIQGLVGSAGGSLAVEALNTHWGKVNGKHLKGLAECGRKAGTAMDGVATLIEGAKIGALVQLGILAAEVIAAQAAAPFTLGLSELGAMGATQATRMILKRLFKEVCQQVAEQVVSIALTPVEEALGAMVGDLVVQLGANALGVQDGVDLGRTAKAGGDGLRQGAQDAKGTAKETAANPTTGLLSAGGSGGGGGRSGGGAGSGFSFDEGEHNNVVTGLQSASGTFRTKAGGKIGRARSHHGRTRGKDAIADAANVVLDKVVDGIEDGVKKTAKHLDENMTRGVKQMIKNHRDNDEKIAEHLKGIGKKNKHDPKSPDNGSVSSANSTGKGRGRNHKTRAQLGKEHPNNSTRTDKAVKDCGDPVDVATGRVFLRQTDIALPGALPLTFTRRFESSYRAGRHMGPSWSSTADQRLEIDDQGIIFVTENGLLLSYETPEPDQRVLPAHGPRWPLTRTPRGDWAVHDPDTGQTRYFTEASHSPGTAVLDELSDRNGNRIAFDYDDETGAPLAIRHSAGYHLKITTDGNGYITALHLADAAADGTDVLVISYGHDEHGNLTTLTNSSGIPTRFEYDTDHRLVAWTDTNDSRYEYTYDHHSRCVAEGGAEGHLRYRFDFGQPEPGTGNRVTTATNSLGHATRYLINDRLQVIAETDPLGHTTRTQYDAYDRPLAVTDPLGHTTRYAYDEHGHLTTINRPDGRQAIAEYNSLGRLVAVTGADGSTWRDEYDSRGNRTAHIDPSGATTRFSYDAQGRPTSVTDALGNTTSLICDPAGLPLRIINPLGAKTRYQRDAFGRVISVTDPLGASSRLAWTVEGRLAGHTGSDGSEQSWTYDGEGNCIAHTNAAGGVTTFEYTHFDQLKARTTQDGARYEFTHDTELQLTSVTNQQGLTWTYEYDPAGHLISETDFDNRTLRYTHTPVGRLATRTNALGQTVTYTHDPLGRIVAKNADGRVTSYQHDPAGRLLQASAPDVELEYRRDSLGRVVTETVNDRTTTFAYDALGRRTHRTTPAGATSNWEYDAASRRTALTASGRTLGFAYDPTGQELARHFGTDLTLTHSWDASGLLTDQSLTAPSGPLQRRSYSYHPDGNLAGIDDQLNGSRTFDLDSAGRVTAVHAQGWSERYAYDESGNQTEADWSDRHPSPESRGPRTYTGTRITRAGDIRYEHDAQGRIVLRQKTRLSRKPETWRYEWDAEDRLVRVITPGGGTWRYIYDPFGRRVAKQRLAPDGRQVLEQTNFTWDGNTLAEQTTASPDGAHLITLTWEHKGLHPIVQAERKSLAEAPQQEIDQRFFAIVTDLIGTPAELVDEDGNIAWRTRTTLWGSTTWNTNATAYTPLRFPGQYFDPETGLHYNNQRYYDPDTARYITPDPLGLLPAPNPTAYVHNPTTWIDPLGLSACPHRKKGGRHSVVLGVNGDDFGSDVLAKHLRENGDPDAHNYNGRAYADDVNGTPVWMSHVMAAVGDPDTTLSITLDGMPNRNGDNGNWNTPESIHEAFLVAVEHGRQFGVGPGQERPGPGHGTAWEMSVVARNVLAFNEDLGGRSWDSIHWYSGNERVTVPEPDIPLPPREDQAAGRRRR